MQAAMSILSNVSTVSTASTLNAVSCSLKVKIKAFSYSAREASAFTVLEDGVL